MVSSNMNMHFFIENLRWKHTRFFPTKWGLCGLGHWEHIHGGWGGRGGMEGVVLAQSSMTIARGFWWQFNGIRGLFSWTIIRICVFIAHRIEWHGFIVSLLWVRQTPYQLQFASFLCHFRESMGSTDRGRRRSWYHFLFAGWLMPIFQTLPRHYQSSPENHVSESSNKERPCSPVHRLSNHSVGFEMLSFHQRLSQKVEVVFNSFTPSFAPSLLNGCFRKPVLVQLTTKLKIHAQQQRLWR